MSDKKDGKLSKYYEKLRKNGRVELVDEIAGNRLPEWMSREAETLNISSNFHCAQHQILL